MAIRDQDRQTLEALRAARETHPELSDLLDFYTDLYVVLFEASTQAFEPAPSALGTAVGLPQLTFDGLRLEEEPFAQLVGRVVSVLLRHNPDWEAGEPLTGAELLALARRVFESWHTLTPPEPGAVRAREEPGEPGEGGLMAQAVAFALAASLRRAADALLPQLDLSAWHEGYCPICGGAPNVAFLDAKTGARRLVCARCDAVWGHSRIGCPFCKSKEKQTYYISDDNLYRLYACPDCERYLKTVDLREVYREVNPLVERLLTVGMDLAARKQGFKGA
jgi:FdhE protein